MKKMRKIKFFAACISFLYTSVSVNATLMSTLKVVALSTVMLMKGGKTNTEINVISSGSDYSLKLSDLDVPFVSYINSNQEVALVVCNDALCSSPTSTVVDSVSGSSTCLSLNGVGNPVISYYYGYSGGGHDRDYDLKLAVCNDASCSSPTVTTITTIDISDLTYVGSGTSLQLNAYGNPVISYHEVTYADSFFPSTDTSVLKLVVCNDASCSSSIITTVDSSGYAGYQSSLVLDSSGNPIISYLADKYLKLAVCHDETCSLKSLISIDYDVRYPSLQLNSDGNAIISYNDVTNGDLKLVFCTDALCSSPVTTVIDSDGDVGLGSSLQLNDAGHPVISYYDNTYGNLKLAICNDAMCDSSIIILVDTNAYTYEKSSLVLDSSDNPIISYSFSSNIRLATLYITSSPTEMPSLPPLFSPTLSPVTHNPTTPTGNPTNLPTFSPVVNTIPSVINSITGKTVEIGQKFTYNFPVGDVFLDEDGDELTLSATELGDSQLPEWLSFYPDTNTFYGEPNEYDLGTYKINVVASDGKGGSAQTFFDVDVVPNDENSSKKLTTLESVGIVFGIITGICGIAISIFSCVYYKNR